MSDQERDKPRVTLLYERYLDAMDEGLEPDEEALLREAGDERAQLERRIQTHKKVYAVGLGMTPEDAPLPKSIGPFQIEKPIQKGGLGRVFLAQDPKLQRRVAIKVLRSDVGGDQRKWILNEARSLARLEHPGVVKIFDVRNEGDRDYIVMEYLGGPSLQQVISELKNLRRPPRDVIPARSEESRVTLELSTFTARVRCLAKIARALAYCHDSGILHRDVSPDNILFDEDGEPRLIDFGLAHMQDRDEDTQIDVTERLVLKPSYACPEQVRDNKTGADARSDQFSFAITAYYLITLHHPFERETHADTMSAILHIDPPPPRSIDRAVSPQLELLLLHALEKEPEDRYESLGALAADCEHFLNHEPISIREPSLTQVARLWFQRNRKRVLALGTTAALVLAGMSGLALLEARRVHAAILTEIEEVEPATPTADEWVRIGHRLQEALRRAGEFDGSLLRRTLLGGLRPTVEARIAEWSDAARADVYQSLAHSNARGLSFQHIAWSQFIELEKDLRPELEDRDLRRRSHVAFEGLDPETEDMLLLQTAFPPELRVGYTRLQEIPRVDELVVGYYRAAIFNSSTGMILREKEFVIPEPWGQSRTIDLGPCLQPRPFLMEIDGRSLDVFVPAMGKEAARIAEYIVPRFLISKLVSAQELRSFLDGWGAPRASVLLRASVTERLGINSHEAAMAYAEHMGGRLPTFAELQLAIEEGLVDIVDHDQEAIGEWVSDLHMKAGPRHASWVIYDRYRALLETPDRMVLGALVDTARDTPWSGDGGPAFRIVYPAATVRDYQESDD